MDCTKRQGRQATLTSVGQLIEVFGCAQHGVCTLHGHGLTRPGGECVPVCATCGDREPFSSLSDRLQAAIQAAERCESKLSPECLTLHGMSSARVRHLLSNLHAANYLEVGSWRGSTLVAACHGQANRATAVDDFSQFDDGTVREALRTNVERLIGSERVTVIGESLYRVPSIRLPRQVDVCFYDGDHDPEQTRRAIWRLFPCLDEESILLVDDTNFDGVLSATRRGLADCGAEIVWERVLPARFNGDVEQWWNGVFVAVIRKPRGPKVSAVCLTFDLPRRLQVLNEAVESFLRQTWPNKELVIVNDTPGTVIAFEHPQVTVLNLPERCATLGDKYNVGCEAATGELLCSWDDDDISLPWRMTRGVQWLGDADYYNPKAYWSLTGEFLRHEVQTGYGHAMSLFRRSAWERVGKYPSVNGPQDALIDGQLQTHTKTILGNGRIEDSGYICRYGDGLFHISTNDDTNAAYAGNARRGEPGTYLLDPKWHRDYVALTRDNIASQSAVVERTARTSRLTIGMACYRDWPGVWATIQSLRLNHAECFDEIEIVVVDNDPQGLPQDGGESSHSSKCRFLCERIGAKYEHFTAVSGTAAAKGRIFELATAPAVLVIDCHVLLPSGVVRRLIDWFEAHPTSRDMWQGPCLGDGGIDDIVGTHFTPNWGSLMYGQWATDPHVFQADEPFEIDMQGCGLFACRRDAWPGFHPLLRGFGPEEFHIHQRIRRRGGRCYCLPWLRWCHRFGNPDGARPPGLHPEERLRGHLITYLDTGAPSLETMRKHFVNEAKSLTNEQFHRVLAETRREFADIISDNRATAI